DEEPVAARFLQFAHRDRGRRRGSRRGHEFAERRRRAHIGLAIGGAGIEEHEAEDERQRQAAEGDHFPKSNAVHRSSVRAGRRYRQSRPVYASFRSGGVLRNSGKTRFPVWRRAPKLAPMRKLNTLGLALLGLVLAAGSFGFATAADSPAPALVRRAFIPAVAGDDSVFVPGQSTATPTPQPGGCAGPRTDVKVLADALAGFDRAPEAATVNQLLMAERPAGITNATARIDQFEARVVEMTVYLQGYQRTASGGIELAIAQSPAGEAMLAYFPPTPCLANTPVETLALISSARTALQLACGNPPDSGIYKPL